HNAPDLHARARRPSSARTGSSTRCSCLRRPCLPGNPCFRLAAGVGSQQPPREDEDGDRRNLHVRSCVCCAPVERAGAVQHRGRRLRQAFARQAGDDLGELRRQRPRACMGRAAGSRQSSGTHARGTRCEEGRPRGRPATAHTRDRRGLLRLVHAHRYILAHEEFVYCHQVEDGERFHGMGEWAWAAGIAPLLGPWRLGALQCVYRREAGFDPHKQLDFLSRHEVTNVFTTPTAMRSMMAIEDAGSRYPQTFRRVCSAGEPLNPEAIRWFRDHYGVTVLDFYGLTESYPLVANYPFLDVREGSM